MKRVLAVKVFCMFASFLLASPQISILQAAAAKNPKDSPPSHVAKPAPVKATLKGSPKGKTVGAPKSTKPALVKPVPTAPRAGSLTHTVKKGQTLFGISRAYHVSIESLVKANHLSKPSALKVGQRLLIPGAQQSRKVEPFKPLSPEQRGEITRSLESEDSEEDQALASPSQDREENSQADVRGTSLPENPSEEATDSAPKASPEMTSQADQEGFIWPLINRITSRFGPRGRRTHTGVDIAAPSYHEVVAAADGEVIYAARSRKGLGNAVVLKHDNGYTTVYGHGVVILVKEGDTVRRGEPILGVGSTGHSTGNHLHFEIRKDGIPIDPLSLMPPTLDELIDGLRAEKSLKGTESGIEATLSQPQGLPSLSPSSKLSP
jgi:murein DD-endopeptidase MepM/ murein hydrolase activator NlpD